MDEKQVTPKSHKIVITNRRTIVLTGVNDVLSFDANEVLLETVQGILMIRGEELHVSRLSLEKGEVDVDGKVDSLTYSDNTGFVKSGETLFGRLFK
ncbi:forespore shell protein [Lachnospiraceae bacterium KM106-2]|nr:forespore shell protein [Lachnospiraceae bacterium KM106-2]